MSKVKNSFLDLVGQTPLVRVNNLIKKDELKADVLAKLEYFNPAGSVKDRIAKEMILDALEKGLINENTTLIEPTSGNTGIGLSAVATALNLKIIITMPETMSVERRNLMKAYGAELVLTPGSEGMKGAIAKAKELASQIENSFIPGQFENPANPTAHYKTTGPEIYEQSRYLCSRSRNRRNNFRDWEILERKESRSKSSGSRTSKLTSIINRERWST